MKIAIGSDHAGFKLKCEITRDLQNDGYDVIDCGTYSEESVDYPDFAEKVAEQVLQNDARGVLICGTGIGISIAANKIPGIRAALCQNSYVARLAREHNDANIVAVGARITGPGLAVEIIRTFLNSEFEGGRHLKRLKKIINIENKHQERS
ncbi:MAG: ribose 5-phosphate isomerase B [Syntrophomonadaceae bacterium]|nr:ribose 5-phosphate isomerase B [Syntrophomonadaceae bacterium]MDD3888585.1 ribose 5-phosphate isomerase B [Syntrophomonadaceae bacterium]MDD4549144.1 ribose 5-phosphate isomerase B [Syntrophomonadaceae bacterium]